MRREPDLFSPGPAVSPPRSRELVVVGFAGGGGTCTGIAAALGRAPDYAINHDAWALAVHAANHPETVHLASNIWRVDPAEVCRGRPVGLAWFSPDCFPSGTLILTDRGYKAIETVSEGDMVLTHNGRYRRVYATMQAVKPLVVVSGQGVPPIRVSAEHPFFTRAATNVWDNERRAYRRTLGDATWTKAADLRTAGAPTNAAGGDLSFWAAPVEFPAQPIPEIGGRGMSIDERLMWLAGRYVGDGWTRYGDGRAELVITCGRDEASALREQLRVWPRTGRRSAVDELAWNERETATAYQFATSHQGLVEWLRAEFGHGAAEKSFPAWALGMTAPLRAALLAGYVSADGSERTLNSVLVSETNTISRRLAFSTKALVESLGAAAQVYGPRPNTGNIGGRAVKARPTYMVRWRWDPERPQHVRDGMHSWTRVRQVVDARETTIVFNISVEEDESYVADGIVVHNCKHFSKAKGGRPVKRHIRDLAWVVVLWAKRARPRVIMLENVEEFRDWGPVSLEGRPCPDRKGETFARWCDELKRLGYRIEWRELRCCDYGVPTTRKRFFLIARRDGRPIVWPQPTHGRPDDPEVLAGRKLPWRTAAEVIDWSLPCPSIFATAEEIRAAYGIAAKRPLAEATMARIAKGVWRYVLTAARPFVVPVTHAGDARAHDSAEPLRTQTTARRGEHAVVTPFLVPRYGERPGQGPRTHAIDEPAPTVVPDGNGGSLVAPVLVGVGSRAGQSPACAADEPLRTITTTKRGDRALVAAHITKFRPNSVGAGLDEPLPTVTANSYVRRPGGAAPLGVVAAFLAQHNTGMVGHDAREPVSTITVGGSHGMSQQALATAHLLNMRGSDRRDRAADEPCPTFSADGNHVAEVRAFLVKYYGEGGQWADCRDPMPTDTTKARMGIVTVEGEDFEIVDIGMRMLTPRERFRAHAFPDDYVIDGLELDGRRITGEIQGRLVGNSVPPPMAAALVAANCADLAVAPAEAAE